MKTLASQLGPVTVSQLQQTWAKCGPPDVPELQIPTFLTVWARPKSPHYWLCGLGIMGVAVQQHLEGRILPTPALEQPLFELCHTLYLRENMINNKVRVY